MKHKMILLYFLVAILPNAVIAQDTLYFDAHENIINTIKKAKSYRIITRNSTDPTKGSAIVYNKSGQIMSQGDIAIDTLSNLKIRKNISLPILVDKDEKTRWVYSGVYKEWYDNGALKMEVDAVNSIPTNRLTVYYSTSNIKRREEYNAQGKQLSSVCYAPNGKEVKTNRFFTTEKYDRNLLSTYQTFFNTQVDKVNSIKEIGSVILYLYINDKGSVNKVYFGKGFSKESNEQIAAIFRELPKAETPAIREEDAVSSLVICTIVVNQPIKTIELLEGLTMNDTIYFNREGFQVKSKKEAYLYDLFTPMEGKYDFIRQTTFLANGQKIDEAEFCLSKTIAKLKSRVQNQQANRAVSLRTDLIANQVLSGKLSHWDAQGQKKIELNFYDNVQEGVQLYFAPDGTIAHKATFVSGRVVEGSVPKLIEKGNAYSVVEKMPQFIGGESALFDYINRNIRYPVEALKSGISGRVIVRFVIDIDGSISQTKVIRSVDPYLDREAIRVLKSLPNWIPGTQNGIPVPVWYTLPIQFSMQQSIFNDYSTEKQIITNTTISRSYENN